MVRHLSGNPTNRELEVAEILTCARIPANAVAHSLDSQSTGRTLATMTARMDHTREVAQLLTNAQQDMSGKEFVVWTTAPHTLILFA
jgi:hypothetical protein